MLSGHMILSESKTRNEQGVLMISDANLSQQSSVTIYRKMQRCYNSPRAALEEHEPLIVYASAENSPSTGMQYMSLLPITDTTVNLP